MSPDLPLGNLWSEEVPSPFFLEDQGGADVVDASVEVGCSGVSDLIGVCGMILLWEAIGVFRGVRVLRLSG